MAIRPFQKPCPTPQTGDLAGVRPLTPFPGLPLQHRRQPISLRYSPPFPFLGLSYPPPQIAYPPPQTAYPVEIGNLRNQSPRQPIPTSSDCLSLDRLAGLPNQAQEIQSRLREIDRSSMDNQLRMVPSQYNLALIIKPVGARSHMGFQFRR